MPKAADVKSNYCGEGVNASSNGAFAARCIAVCMVSMAHRHSCPVLLGALRTLSRFAVRFVVRPEGRAVNLVMAAIGLNHIQSARWRQKYTNTRNHLPLSVWNKRVRPPEP